jgi:hypothetical protein
MSTEKKTKLKPLTDEDILVRVEGAVRKGVGWYDSKLSTERERVTKYANLELPRRQNEGRSSYTSSDVFDSVEAMKAQLLETFAGNPDNLVSFPPQGPEDISDARVATEYCNYQVHRLNNGYQVFHDVIADGLSSRVGVTKVFWEKIDEAVEEELLEAPEADAQALAAREDVTEFDAEETGVGTGLYTGRLTRKIDRSKVTLLPVPPEEFLIEERARSIPDAGLVSHRTRKMRSELIAEGYDRKKVESIQWEDVRSLDLTSEQEARHTGTTEGLSPDDDPLQEELQKVMFYETYAKLDIRDGRGVRLWKVCHAGNVLLDKQEVDRAPFVPFVPLPIAHAFHGNNFAARVVQTQNARTMLTRAILDHASVTTNPRWQVLKGGLMNPKEMLDNRLGGIVNTTRPDAVTPLMQQNLNPFVYSTLEMLKANKEESTGISALSQGMNKEAISTQNSDALIDRLVTLSQQRQKIVARNFAFNYLIPLYLEVYRLVLENEKVEKIIEVAGEYKKVDPARWVERLDCKAAVHVGYGDREKQAAKHLMLYKELAADPLLTPSFKLENRYALAMDTMRMDGGFDNFNAYLTPPEKTDPPQPNPLEVAEVQAKTKSAEASMITAQSAALKAAKAAEAAASKEMLNELKAHIDSIFRAREADRQDDDVANRIDVAQREIALLEKAPAESQNAIVSPS